MGIYKCGKTWWASYQQRGVQMRTSLKTGSRQAAQIKYARLLQETPQKIQEAADMGKPLAFGQFLSKFRDFIKTEKAANTCKRYEIGIKWLMKCCEIEMLSEITPLKIQEVKTALIREGKSAVNINRIMQALKTMMRTAEKWELVPPQRWDAVSRMKQKRGRVVFHTEEEIQAMLEAAPNGWYRLVIKLGCRAGLRRGEMAALRWEDIDFKKNEIYIRANKTEDFRLFSFRHKSI